MCGYGDGIVMIFGMTILHIIAVLVSVLVLAYLFRVSLVEAMPVFTCLLIFVLYALAMAGRLSWIDGIAAAAIVSFGIMLAVMRRERRKDFGKVCLENVTQPSFLTAVFLLTVVVVCTSGKAVTWWDDINFWAADVKALYFLDGFAGKYANVAPEFGDYPPAAQLMKWWFLHLNPREYQEGLAFAGYYVLNLVFMLPLLRGLKGRNAAVMAGMAAALWFLPSIAEVYGYDGFCADLTMACIYGGFLYAVTDTGRETGNYFYDMRLALYLGVLVLVKSIGFVWALFGLVFLMAYRGRGSRRPGLAVTAAVPVLTGGSWLVFCLFMRRVTKTTATAVKYMTTDEYGISGYTGEFAGAFLKAFVGSPLHKEKSPAIDLTPLGLYLCICAIVVLYYRAGSKKRSAGHALLPRREGRIILWFTVVSGALFYGIIFLAHITIFATETQYLEPAGMISSIERYGAPFTVGTLLFLGGVWLDRGGSLFQREDRREKMPGFIQKYGVYLCFILLVALTAGYRVGYHGLIGYRDTVAEKLAERADMIGRDEAQFLDAVRVLGRDSGTRVCYIRRGDVPRWVNNSYAAYEASPVSVVYRSVNLDDAPSDWMVQEIRATHAAYLYAEETDADAGAVFDGITADGAFRCGVLYQIADDEGRMKLTQVSQ